MVDLSDIPEDVLLQKLQEFTNNSSAQPSGSPVPQPAQASTSSENAPLEKTLPDLPHSALNIVKDIVLPTARFVAGNSGDAPLSTPDTATLALRGLAALPMGIAQFGAEHIPILKDTQFGKDVAESVANRTKQTNDLRGQYDKEHDIGNNFADNITDPDYLIERGAEVIPQIAQAGFVGKLLKPLEALPAGEAAAPFAKTKQYLGNTAAGAATGAAFGGLSPVTGDTSDNRDEQRLDAGEGGALLGGALSALAPPAIGAYNAVSNRLSPVVQAAKRLQTIVGTDKVPDFIEAIDRNAPLAEAIPGYQPTTAQLAENPGMAALERGSRSPASPLAGEIGAIDTNNRQAISSVFQGNAPANQEGPWGLTGEAGDPAPLKQQAADLMNTAKTKTKTKVTAADNAVNDAKENAAAASQQQAEMFPKEDTGDISAQLNDKLKSQYRNDRQVKNDLFDLDPDGTTLVNPTNFVNSMTDSLNKIDSPYARAGATPGFAQELLNMVKRPSEDPTTLAQIEALSDNPETQEQLKKQFAAQLDTDYNPQISFKQLQEYRPILSDEIKKARLAGDGLKVQVLSNMKAALENYTTELANSDNPEVAAKAKRALDFYANVYAPKWKNGPGKQYAKGISTYNEIPSETVASKFIRPGNAGADTLRNLNLAVRDDPTIQPIIEKYVLGDLQQQKGLIDENGIIDPNKIDAWMQKNYQTLKMNPELAAKIGNMRDAVGTANENADTMLNALKQRQTIYNDQQKALNDSILSKLLNKENTRDVIRSALSSDTPVKNVRSLINIAKQDNSGKALKGLQQAAFDHLKEDLTNVQTRATSDATEPLSLAKLDTYLDNPAKTNALKMIIGDDGLNRLKAARTGLRLMSTMGNFQNIPGSATSLNQAAEGLTMRMLRNAGNFITGGQGKIINLGMLKANKALQGQVGDLMQKAVVDPQFAKQLATYQPPKRFNKVNTLITSGMPQAFLGEQSGQAGQ